MEHLIEIFVATYPSELKNAFSKWSDKQPRRIKIHHRQYSHTLTPNGPMFTYLVEYDLKFD